MTRHLILLSLVLASFVQAQQGAPTAESRMRDALKKVMLQLRDSQTAQAAAQAAQAEAEAKNLELTTKLADLTKQLAKETKQGMADKDAAEKTIAGLTSKVGELDREVAKLNEALAKWKEGFQKAADVARAKENERAEMAGKVILMERRVAEDERKNAALYKVGSEVLDRYQNFGLGTALLAREPFVGTMRVKFQNLMQDYGDKLATERIKPSESGDVHTKTAPSVASQDARPKAGIDKPSAPASKP